MFSFLRFPSGVAAHLHMSWLDPHKTRSFTVVGSRKMATFDDMELERKVTVYDKGFDEDSHSYGEYITRSGDIYSPRISNREPLRIECEHFVECVREGRPPRSDGEAGLRVVRVLAELQANLDATAGRLALMSEDWRTTTPGDPLAGYTSPPPPGAGGVPASASVRHAGGRPLAAGELGPAGRRAPARSRRARRPCAWCCSSCSARSSAAAS